MQRLFALLAMLPIVLGATAAPSADSLFMAGKFDRAQIGYAAAVAAKPHDANALYGLARTSLYRNELDKAEKYAHAALAIRKDGKVAALLDTIAQRRAVEASAAALDVPAKGVAIPFVKTDPLPLIQLKIDGRAANLIVDTGARDLTIDPDFAKELGLAVAGGRMGTFAGGRTAQVRETAVHRVDAGSLTLRDLKADVLPSRGLDFYKGLRVDGVVGTVFLSRFRSTLDFPSRRLLLQPRDGNVRYPDGAIVVPFWLVGDHFIFAKGSINNLDDQLFLVDSGLAGGGIDPEVATIARAHVKTFPKQASQGMGGGGMVEVIPVLADRLCLGDACQTGIEGSYTPSGSPLSRLPFKTAGIVSHAYLERYAVTFDFARMQIVLFS